MGSTRGYSQKLLDLAVELDQAADEAERLGVHGLGESLRAAAASARSSAPQLFREAVGCTMVQLTVDGREEPLGRLPRGFCPDCERDVALRKNGLTREHRDPDSGKICLGSARSGVRR